MHDAAPDRTLIIIAACDPDTIQTLSQLIEQEGYALAKATSGAEALDLCQRHHPHLLISETSLRDLDAIELCRQLHALPDNAHTPVVLISDSIPDAQFTDRAIAAGVVDCIEKPLQPRWFSQRIHYLMRTRLAEEALEQERSQWQAVIDNVPDFIYVKDTEGHFVRANVATALAMGATTSAELIGKSDFDFQPHDLAAQHFAAEQEFLKTGQPLINWEEPFLDRGTGNLAYYLSSKVPLRDLHGEIVGLVGVGRNITERKREEEVSERERSLLHTLIDHLPDYIFAKDIDGRFLISNLAHALAANASPEALVGKTAFDMFPPHLAVRFHADDEEIMKSGKAMINADRRSIDARGAERSFLTTKVPLTNSQGQVIGLVGISRDVTEYKQTAEALRKNEERYRVISDMISDYAFCNRIAPDGSLSTEWETELLIRSSGYTPAEMLEYQEARRYTIFHPDDQAQASSDMAKILAGEAVNNDYRIITKDGETRWIHLHRQPVWDDAQQRVERYYGVAQDITEHKQMEEKLTAEHNLLRTVIDNIPDQIFIKDIEGRFLLANRAVVDVMGLATVDDLIGHTDADFLPAHLAEGYRADDQQVIESGQALINREEFTVDPTGVRGWLLTTKVLLRDARGTTLGVIGIARNITERKRMDQALQESEARSREIFEKAAIGIALADKDGNLFETNTALQRMLGYSQGEFRGLSFSQVTHPQDVESEWTLFRDLLAGKRDSYQLAKRYYHKDGSLVWGNVTVSLVRDADGQLRFAIGMVEDITERKQAEKQALELAVAQQKVQALRTFVQDASHDLNTPITSLITGNYITRKLAEQVIKQTITISSQALSTPSTISDPMLNEISQTTMKLYEQTVSQEKAAIRLRKTVADLIKITQLDYRPSLDLALHDLYSVMTTVVDLCTPLAADKNITLQLEHDIDLPFVAIDEDEFTHAIQNITQNAISYTPAGGRIMLRVYRHEQEVAIAVTDTGPGIEKANLPYIFDRFYRADKARSVVTGGSGLGLAITKNIVEAHKGRIEVESEVGKGSTFTIFLPIDDDCSENAKP